MTYAEELKREGRQEGRQETQQEIAKQLLKAGVDRNIVANATHLSLDEINSFDKK